LQVSTRKALVPARHVMGCLAILASAPLALRAQAPLPAAKVDGLASLRALEKHSIELHDKIAPLVVSVRSASGVLYKDGLVVTAAHVIDRPGRRVPIVLADGRRFFGKTLGVDERSDAGLVQLELPEGTKLPSVELGESKKLQTGQWVWMFGHPGSRQPHGAPLRFGRVLRNYPDWIVTDCEMSGGDSGGPLFDHEGRLIGIHSRITQRLDVNMHVPIHKFVDEWEALLAGKHLKKSSDKSSDQNSGKDSQENKDSNNNRSSNTRNRPSSASERSATRTSARGIDRRDVLNAASTLSEPLRESIVRFVVVGRTKAYGIVVAPGGLVLTKASQLGSMTRVRLHDRSQHDYELLAKDDGEDLALVRIPVELPPLELSTRALQPGAFLFSASPRSSRPIAMGVLSVPERVGDRRAWMGIRFGNGGGIPIQEVLENTPAAQAGLEPGDRIVRIDGKEMRNRLDLLSLLMNKRDGEVIEVELLRDRKEQKLSLTLGAHPDRHGPVSRQQRMGLFGSISEVRRGFSRVLQHDSRLRDTEMGGPLLDTQGRVIGMNIARAGRIETRALPSSSVAAALERMMTEAGLGPGAQPRRKQL
jgi:serine protease Do